MSAAPGVLIAVVGPSGAGKDSILRAAQARLSGSQDFVFPRRVVTRQAQVESEDHDSLSEQAFEKAAAAGQFAIWWRAHGNAYGIPAAAVAQVAEGKSVVFNCSRAVLAELLARFPMLAAIEISAAPAILAGRILARGREAPDAVAARVSRRPDAYPAGLRLVRIDNSGELEDAVSAFCAALLQLHNAAANPGGGPLDQQDKREDGNDRRGGLVIVEQLQ